MAIDDNADLRPALGPVQGLTSGQLHWCYWPEGLIVEEEHTVVLCGDESGDIYDYHPFWPLDVEDWCSECVRRLPDVLAGTHLISGVNEHAE